MIALLVTLFSVFFAVLIGRLFLLQVIEGGYFASKALNQQLSVSTISPIRGTIYDSNMVPLAESATAWDVVASPSSIKTDTMRNSIADNLAKILSIDRQTVYKQLSNKNSSYEVIAKKIDQPSYVEITNYINKSKVSSIVGTVEDSKRYYPFGNFASQLLGFTGTDDQGLSGIESEYDSFLKGVPGKVLTAENAKGADMPYNYAQYVNVQNGGNLVLTIDEVVQHYLETDLSKAVKDNNVTSRATGIVMDVNTGEILGMATEPSFDPNAPFTISDPTVAASLSSLTGNALKQATNVDLQTQWRNKAISDPYEPGSTFKVVTTAAALEEDELHQNDTFSDPGQITIDGTTFHDWDRTAHGTVTFAQGFENSWNVVFIQVGETLGTPDFFKYFLGFGLTEKTGIDLPGEAESLYLPENQFSAVNLASYSFGQTFKITPIQLITAIAASANGGYLVQPHVVKEETDQNGNVIKDFDTTVKRQVISPETSKEIDNLLEMEVNEGSGKNAYVAGYRIGGKTGTAQKTDSADPNGLIASFVGVAPSDDPQIAVLVILDDPHNPVSNYGSVIAAPVAGSIFSEILPYLGVEPVYTAAELQSLEIKTPSVTNKSVAAANSIIIGAGLKISVKGTGQTVTGQTPASGGVVQKNGTVVVYTGNMPIQQNVTVPKLIGLSPDEVSSTLAGVELNVKFVGLARDSSGETAYDQDISYGSKVAPGTVITVKFRDNQLAF
jgi:stage V sporulation protein D (sporulation-specific penicillin-binding protein)